MDGHLQDFCGGCHRCHLKTCGSISLLLDKGESVVAVGSSSIQRKVAEFFVEERTKRIWQ
jgi:hypothetical protein